MRIKLKITAELKKFFLNDADFKTVDVREGTTVQEVIELLEPRGSLKLVYWVNNKHADSTTVLKDGDRLLLMPMMLGG